MRVATRGLHCPILTSCRRPGDRCAVRGSLRPRTTLTEGLQEPTDPLRCCGDLRLVPRRGQETCAERDVRNLGKAKVCRFLAFLGCADYDARYWGVLRMWNKATGKVPFFRKRGTHGHVL
jgi:hypothetical protein